MAEGSSGVLGSVAVEVKADLSKLIDGFARAKAQSQGFSADMQRAAGSTRPLTMAQAELSKQMDGIVRQYDPMRAARAKYLTDLTIVQQAEKAGLATSAESAVLQRSMAAAFVDTTKKIEGESIGLEGMARHMEHHVRAMRLLIGFIGVDLVKSAGEFAIATLEATGQLKYQADALGITTEQLQEYRGLAPQVGMSAKEMDSAFGTLNKTLTDISLGASPQAMKVIDALGVQIFDTATGKVRPTETIFKELIAKLGQVGDESQRRGAQVLLFGEAGNRMGDLVAQGSEGVDKLKQAVKDTGAVLSDEQIQKADQTAKKLDELWTVLKAKIATTVVENADSIYTLADAFSHLAANAITNSSNQITAFIQKLHDLRGAVEEFMAGSIMTGGTNPAAGAAWAIGNDLDDYAKGKKPGSWMNNNLPSYGLNQIGTSNTIKLSDATVKGAPPAKPKGPNINLSGLLNTPGPKGRKGAGEKFDTFEQDMAQEKQRQLQLEEEMTTNVVRQNEIEKQLADMKLKEREQAIDRQVKHGELTRAEAAQLKHAAGITASMEKEEADHKLRIAQIEAANQYADEMARLDEDGLNTAKELARTDAQRKTIDAAILHSKQQQAVSELQKQITLAQESKDEQRVGELTAELAKLRANQLQEWKSFDLQHLNPMQQYQNNLPKTADEFNDQVKSMAFDKFNEKLAQAGQFADELGDDFGKAAADLAQFKPRQALQDLINGLAQTFTKNFIEKPVSDYVRDHLGAPLAKQAFGKDLDKLAKQAGGTALTTSQMNTALAQATQSLYLLTSAARSAATAVGAKSATGGGFSASDLGSLFGGGSLTAAGAGGLDFGSILGSIGGSFSGGDLAGLGDTFALGSVPFSFGFASGGYTGSGADHEAKGVVHANEFVISADAVRKIGLPYLHALNGGMVNREQPGNRSRLPGYAAGGFVGREPGLPPALQLGSNPFTATVAPPTSSTPTQAAGGSSMENAAAMLMQAAQMLMQAAQGGKKGGAGGILTSLLGIGTGMLLGGKGGGAGGLLAGLFGGGKSLLSSSGLAGMIGGAGSFSGASLAGMGSSFSLGSLPLGGFDGGGFTGSGADHEVKGVVHANEYVWDADTTRTYMPILKMIHTGKMPTVPSMPSPLGGRQGGGPLHVSIGDVHLHGVSDPRAARQSANQFMAEVQQRTARVVKKGLNQ